MESHRHRQSFSVSGSVTLESSENRENLKFESAVILIFSSEFGVEIRSSFMLTSQEFFESELGGLNSNSEVRFFF